MLNVSRGLPLMCFLGATLVLTGCGGKGDLSGTVSLGGKKLTTGSVQVLGADGIPKSGDIQRDGSYVIKDIVSGPARIAVHSPDPGEIRYIPRKKDEKPPPPKDRSGWFAIPEKYGDFDKSEITFEIRPGENRFPIELK